MTIARSRWLLPAATVLAAATAIGCGDDAVHQAAPEPCDPAPGRICTVAGTGVAGDGADGLAALDTRLYLPQDVTVGPDGRLYIVDWNNHRIRVRAVSPRASCNEPLERGQFVACTMGKQPAADVVIAIKLRERVRCAAIGAASQRIRAMLDEQLDHRHVPSSSSDVERRFTVVTPGEVRVGAMFQQPARPGRIR